MKIVFLNIWGGKTYEPLMAFLRAAADDTDFFCLQEIFDSPERGRTVSWGGRADIYKDLCAVLPDFTPYYAISVHDFDGDLKTDFPLSHGIAIFTRKDVAILSQGDFLISGENWQGPGTSEIFPHKFQYVRFEKDDVPYTLANVHGVAFPGDKRDTPERLAQSQKIIDFLASERGKKILGGDFNLMPDTESIRMIERAGMPPHPPMDGGGMRNLVTEFSVTDTRGAIAHAQYPPSNLQYFADFAFVSPDIRVSSFAAPELEISDHLPLILECA